MSLAAAANTAGARPGTGHRGKYANVLLLAIFFIAQYQAHLRASSLFGIDFFLKDKTS
ncbi:MAG: hypothetical protein ABIT82_13100 [Ramlibacter sp.]